MRRYIIQGLCGWLVLLAACTAEEERIPIDGDGGSIALTARKEHLITKAGDEVNYFPEGTKYRIYAREGDTWKLDGVGGTGADGGLIELDGQEDPLTYGNNPLSFYGVTYGTTDKEPLADRTDGSPTITETGDHLPDLMYSNNLKDQTAAANGYRLRMDFKHALCKLNFRIVKQDESEDDRKELKSVTLKQIVVKGTHKSGTFDIVEGTWNYNTDEASYARTYYNSNGTDGMPITTENEDVTPNGGGDFLIFPNGEDEEIVVAVTLSGITGITGDKTVEYHLRAVSETGQDEGVFRFQSNHQYTLVITVLKDDVRVVAIAPQVYDWVDVDNKHYLGQPVTFAGLMWMDRNLGAKSADCENDWESCRGYYYQYGRNIPYILDMDKYELAVNGTSTYEFLYTYNQKGEKVYGGLTARSTDPLTGLVARYPNVAINPGDEGIYKFVSDISNGGVWLFDENNNEYSGVNQFWTSSVENHPCPKGWRLPTAADFATFMPDITLTAPWNTTFHVPQHYTGAILKEPEEMVYGKINGESAIYLIKRRGKPDCYRIRIVMKESNVKDKYYFEFAYFSGDENMTFMDLTTEEAFIASMSDGRFDWSTPSAIMQVPAVGFIHPSTAHKLDGDGENAILRTSEWKTSGTNWVCYLRNSWKFGLISESRKALGDQIRCVRDINADMY